MRAFSTLASVAIAVASPPAFDLLRGHTEIQIEYDNGAWWAGVSYTLSNSFDNPQEGDVIRIDADDMEFVMPPLSREISGVGSSFLLAPGEPIWRIPQGFKEGTQFVGIRVLVPNGAFQTGSNGNFIAVGRGNINLSLLSVDGSGAARGGLVGSWQDGNGFSPPTIGFNTSDGIDGDDEIRILPPGTHTHYNWVFTKPGVYKLNMEATGRLADGTDTAHPFTMTFQVPHEGTLASADLALAHSGTDWELLCRDTTDSVTYGEKHCYLCATTPSSRADFTGWEIPTSLGETFLDTMDFVGVSKTFAMTTPTFAGGITLQLVEHVGPGNVIAANAAGDVIVDSRDGLDASDLLGGVETFYFSQAGIHRLAFVATGRDASGQVVATSRPLTLRCGANLAPNHSYAEWADSYVRAYSLTTDALSDPAADYDCDGLHNQAEYLLDAMGMNPAVSDEAVAFDSSQSEAIRFIYLRDLHKDKLDDSSPALLPGFSPDLVAWDRIGAGRGRNGLPIVATEVAADGLPLRMHERPVVTGNARSRFMRRALIDPSAPPRSGFFRFETN